jgi:hypothetical protein
MLSSSDVKQSGSVPTETITVGSTKVEFHSWERLVQLNFVRQTLAEGTLVHFEVPGQSSPSTARPTLQVKS